MEVEQLKGLSKCCLYDGVLEKDPLIVMKIETTSQTEKQMLFQLSLLEQMGKAVIALDFSGKITYWNQYATTLYQWQAAEVISKKIYEVMIPAISHRRGEEMLNQVAKLRAWEGEFLVQRKDGTQFWVDMTSSPLKDPDEQAQGVVVVSADATERRRVEEALQQSLAANRSLFNGIPDAIFRMRKDGTFLDFKAAKDFDPHLGNREFLGKTIAEILPPEINQLAMEQIERSLRTGEMQSFEYQLIKDDKPHEFEARVVPSGSEEVLAIVRDVTERKQAELQLAKNEERYRIVTELISDYVYAARIDIKGNLLPDWITGAFSRICGFTCEEIKVRGGWQTLIYPEDLLLFEQHIQNLLYWQSDVREYRIFTKKGEVRWLRDYSQPVECDEENHVLLIYGAAQDITERKQAEEVLRQQTERERLLGMMQERIRQSLNLDEILQQAVAEVRSFLQVERVAIYRLDCQSQSCGFVVESNVPNCSSVLGVQLEDFCLKTYGNENYQHGQVTAIDDIYEEHLQPEDIQSLGRLGIRANLIVPIVYGTGEQSGQPHLWGLLCAHHCSSSRHWQAFEIDSLQQLTAKIAIAIQQSELYQQIQRLNADLERQVEERTRELQKALEIEATLKRITDKVRDSLDESQILQTAVQEVAVKLGVDSCNASLYDLEAGTATICFEYAVSIPATYGRVALITNFPEIYNQLLQKQYFQFCSLLPHPTQGRRARLACPIFDNEGVLGDLWLVNHHDYVFSDLEVRLLQQVANQCAIAIRQARLYQAAQAQVAELEKLNRLKDDFLSTVSHELRTPMSNIRMAIQMIRVSPNAEKRQRYLDILQSECNRETELINDLLDLQRLEADSYPLLLSDAIDLQEWLPGIVDPFRSRIQEHQQTLRIEVSPNLPIIISDRNGLGRILAELLNNACKYTPANREIVLRINDELKTRSIGEAETLPCYYRPIQSDEIPEGCPVMIFTVSNQAEIPARELSHLFNKFYRVPKADLWKQGGTGLGLALIQRLVVQMSGTIQVESRDGWTTFRVELPMNGIGDW